MDNRLFMVIPCYNEEEVLPETARRVGDKMRSLIQKGKIAGDSRVLFVNDGSKDATWHLICELHREDKLFSGLNLSRNRGHQNALLAGLMAVKELADMTISMDADLQDDIDAAEGMVDEYAKGNDVVYGVRKSRKKDTFFKRFTAEGYYKLIDAMGGEVVFNHADYRLLSRRALAGLAEYGESNLFLRGIVPLIGYPSAVVSYERDKRFAGESKYPLKKMLALAWEGICSLSVRPIRMVMGAGLTLLFASALLLVVFLIGQARGISMLNWKIVLFALCAVGGLVLVGIGVVGEYVGKIYMEVKGRPRFIVERFLHEEE